LAGIVIKKVQPVLDQIDIESLVIVEYPNPTLRMKCEPITDFGDHLVRLARRMCELMHGQNGVGLAGPQVGLPLRIFVWNATGAPGDDRISINPILSELEGQVDAEEGCLSIPDVTVRVKRASAAKLMAFDAGGSQYELCGSDLTARIWQHENDHLDGRLILDYQSPGEEITHRKVLKELAAKFIKAQPAPRTSRPSNKKSSKKTSSPRSRRR
jgi:peptide deformylase